MQVPEQSTVSLTTALAGIFLAIVAFAVALLSIDMVRNNNNPDDSGEKIRLVTIGGDTGVFYVSNAKRRTFKLVRNVADVPQHARQLAIVAEPGMSSPLDEEMVYVVDLTAPIGPRRYRAHRMRTERVVAMADIAANVRHQAMQNRPQPQNAQQIREVREMMDPANAPQVPEGAVCAHFAGEPAAYDECMKHQRQNPMQ